MRVIFPVLRRFGHLRRYGNGMTFQLSMKQGNSSIANNSTLPSRTAYSASYYANTSTPSMRKLPLVARIGETWGAKK